MHPDPVVEPRCDGQEHVFCTLLHISVIEGTKSRVYMQRWSSRYVGTKGFETREELWRR